MGVLCYFTRKRLPSILFTRRTKYFYRVKIICQPLSDILSTLYYLLLKCFHYFRHAFCKLKQWETDSVRSFILLTSLNFESRGELFQPGWASSKETVVGLCHEFVNGALNDTFNVLEIINSIYASKSLPWIPLILWFWSEALCSVQGRVFREGQSFPLRSNLRASWHQGWSSQYPLMKMKSVKGCYKHQW